MDSNYTVKESSLPLHSNKNTIHIPTPSTRPRIRSFNREDNIALLHDAWKKLPKEERDEYSGIATAHVHRRHVSHSPDSPVKKKRIAKGLPLPQNEVQPKNFNLRRSTTDIRNSEDPQISLLEHKSHDIFLYEIPYKNELYLDELLYRLYVGDINAANSQSSLSQHMIEAVLSLCLETSPEKFPSIRCGYLRLGVEKDLSSVLESAQRFLDSNIGKCNILIQCETGKMYAPVIVIGYLMRRFNIVYSFAKDLVSKYIPDLYINEIFERQLHHMS